MGPSGIAIPSSGSLQRLQDMLLSWNGGPDNAPFGILWRSSTTFIISTVALGMFTDLFLYGLIVPVIPFMLEERVHTPKDQIQSQVSMLLAVFAGASMLGSPIAGILADRVPSRQSPFLIGLFILTGATILLAAGKSILVLSLARILQGMSGAVVWTVGLAICIETVGPRNLGKTIGSIISITAAALLTSPVLGGVLYKQTGYAGVFGIGIALLSVDFIMRALMIEKKIAAGYLGVSAKSNTDGNATEGRTPSDPSSISATTPLLANQDASSNQDPAYRLPPNPSYLARKIPILPCLANPRILTAFLIAFTQSFLLGASDSTVPTVAEDAYSFDSLKAGLLFLPICVWDLLLGPVCGWAVDRYGTKPAAVLGFTFLVPVLVLLRLPHAGGVDQIILYCGLLCLYGIGLAITGSPSIVEAGDIIERYYRANPERFGPSGPYAQLYGVNSMVFSAGLTVGPLVAGYLKELIGYGNMNAVLAGLCALTALFSWFFIGGPPSWTSMREEDEERALRD